MSSVFAHPNSGCWKINFFLPQKKPFPVVLPHLINRELLTSSKPLENHKSCISPVTGNVYQAFFNMSQNHGVIKVGKFCEFQDDLRNLTQKWVIKKLLWPTDTTFEEKYRKQINFWIFFCSIPFFQL